MRLFVFTKKEDCNIYLCFEEIFKRKKGEFYLFELLNFETIQPLLQADKSNIVIIDYESYGQDTLSFVERLKKNYSNLQIIITNAPQNVDLAVKFFTKGVQYFLTTDLDKNCLCSILNEISESLSLPVDSSEEVVSFFVGNSKPIRRIKEFLPTIAETNCNVLIVGETGTGKELLARVIHQLSPRRNGPFITLDCTTLQETIFESEVFGYEKGAFTGAVHFKKGLVELADGGTLFIDEIGELPLPLQKKFLRFIQEKTFLRVGGTKFLKADVRIIAATNRNLEEEVRKGNFRADLYFRLNTLIIEIPPLRERKEDLPLLLEHFLKLKAQELGRPFKGFSKKFLECLLSYNWPGNVRELINVIERVLVLAKEGYLTEDLLPNYLKNFDLSLNNSEEQGKESSTKHSLSLPEIEKEVILEALKKHNWNQTKTAEYLGISRKQLLTKLKRYNLLKRKEKQDKAKVQ
ncbi:MAG: sigma-54 dependent transcriptional regulator [Caldimicrobium sp.]|nr:sigma-54 dependent transcriptional regulator [Caldimicrobium sp.]MCX7873392.1 sigma-54 dependent transcriptional regulator [Caldimicrobium sp.]MDW8094370.1 sigma-54 dependent transcriptional regulator [Caldimicrobium sp.]